MPVFQERNGKIVSNTATAKIGVKAASEILGFG